MQNFSQGRTYTFYVSGLRCRACAAIIEAELGEVPEVSEVGVSFARLNVRVTGEFGDKKAERVAGELNEVLKSRGYTLSLERSKHAANWSDFNLAIPIAVGFIVFFIILQKIGIMDLVIASRAPSYGTVFLIGLLASVSSCLAIVGGLALSISASFAKKGDRVRPQALFHIGRLVSFFLLGGAIGAFGSAWRLGATGEFTLNVIVAMILLILGVNLLDVFPWAKKLQPTLPGIIGRRAHRLKNLNHTLTPLLVGAATFFLPCGFTQSMQIHTLTAGSFCSGALYMSVFALGTLPMLALLSFSSLGIHQRAQSGAFFKAAGLIVIFFGIFNLINALVAAGIVPPLFSF